METHWASCIAADGKPVLVILEGLTMYLTEPDVKQIFAIIATHFPDVTDRVIGKIPTVRNLSNRIIVLEER